MNIAIPRSSLASAKLGAKPPAKPPGWTLDTQNDWRHDGALVGEKLGLARNKAVDTAARVIGQAVKQGDPLHIVGHSQGALVASRAVAEVLAELRQEGLSQEQAEKAISPITVTSLGGSAWTYPEGPTYHHYYNDRDLVPLLTGRPIPAKIFDSSKETVHRFSSVSPSAELPPWENGWANRFARYVDATVHGARQVYLPRFKPQGEKESA